MMWKKLLDGCNIFSELFKDIVASFQDSWKSVLDIINHFGDIQEELIPVAGPGNFNDPDMVCSQYI